MKKIGIWAAALALAVGLFAQPVTVHASETAKQAETSVAESAEVPSAETVSEVLDFVKEKWDAGAFKSDKEIQEAIEEGEEKFGVDLGEDLEKQLAKILKGLDGLGVSSDTAIDAAKKLYEEKGEEIAGQLQELYEEQSDKFAEQAGKLLKENLVEPAKEAAKAAVENTAKNFWKDLKSSVGSFIKNIFE